MTQAVKRACDACHRRKVKCDGINPCRNCSQAQLSCTYNAIPQKKGPKGSRAKVISELRETQRQTSLSAKVQSRLQGVPCAPPTGLAPTPGLLTSELVKDCVAFFFDNLYPQLPILDRRQTEQQILYMEQSRDAYCLLTSLCAFVMLQPGMQMPAGDLFNFDMMPGANIISSQLLVEEAVRVRKSYEYLDAITHNAVATNFFLFGCHYGQEMHDRAWYYLREATTMVHLAGMHKEDHYLQFDSVEATRRRRLFWLLYATERAYAIQRNRPLTLQATINLPTVRDDPTDPYAHQLNGFVLLVSLFKPFDDNFVATWNKARAGLSASHVTSLQKQLNEIARSYACQDSTFSDFHTNQQWLKSTVWQLTNGSVNDDPMSFQYANSVPRDMLMAMASQFQGHGLELLNSGLIERLMEITHLMNEFLSLQPASHDPFAVGPREHMNQLLNMVAMSRNGDHRFLPVLMSKTAELLPRLVNPMLQNPPENPNLANVDIFDGFGNAGMAQPPAPQMQMQMETEYDHKLPPEEYDSKYAMEMSGATPDSQANSSKSSGGQSAAQQGSDLNGSFGSPGIMSPGMDYSQSMNGFSCTHISEMVMSPIGHAAQSTPMANQPQVPQQMGHCQEPMGTPHMGGMHNGQGMGAATMPTSHPAGNMRGMPEPQQRQGSFHLQGPPPQMRTVGDFQGLQRTAAPSEARGAMVGMGSMSNEIDFGPLQ